MNLYRIKDWDKHFENNRTRELKNMPWLPLPTKLDGDGYTELVEHKNGAAHFGAWTAILKVAGRCDLRGTLLRGNSQPHTSESLARITRLPKKVFDEVLPRLVSIGWVEVLEQKPQEGAEIPQEGAECLPLHNIREDNIKDSCDVPSRDTFKAWWNELASKHGLGKIRKIPDDRWKKVQARCKEGFWEERAEIEKQLANLGEFARGWFDFEHLFANSKNWMRLLEERWHKKNDKNNAQSLEEKKWDRKRQETRERIKAAEEKRRGLDTAAQH